LASRQPTTFDGTCGIGSAEADRVGSALLPLLLRLGRGRAVSGRDAFEPRVGENEQLLGGKG